MIGKARAFRPDLHEGLVDQQQSAAAAQAIGEGEQRILGNQPSIGIVRIDDNSEIRASERIELPNLLDIPARSRQHPCIFIVGRRKDARAAGWRELRQQLNGGLGTAPRDDRRACAVSVLRRLMPALDLRARRCERG